jgi:hypothetical protein
MIVNQRFSENKSATLHRESHDFFTNYPFRSVIFTISYKLSFLTMIVRSCHISLIVFLVSLFSVQAFSQQMNIDENHSEDNSAEIILKPRLNYTVGSNFMVVPRLGSFSSVTLSPSISVPLTPKLSVDGGIIAGYYYSTPWKSNNEGLAHGSFTGLSVYGSASYHFNPQFTLYGSAIKQLAGSSPVSYLPKTSYSIGSTYDFGNIKIGVSFRMSEWNNIYSPFPVNGSNGFYSPFEQSRIFH